MTPSPGAYPLDFNPLFNGVRAGLKVQQFKTHQLRLDLENLRSHFLKLEGMLEESHEMYRILWQKIEELQAKVILIEERR